MIVVALPLTADTLLRFVVMLYMGRDVIVTVTGPVGFFRVTVSTWPETVWLTVAPVAVTVPKSALEEMVNFRCTVVPSSMEGTLVGSAVKWPAV